MYTYRMFQNFRSNQKYVLFFRVRETPEFFFYQIILVLKIQGSKHKLLVTLIYTLKIIL